MIQLVSITETKTTPDIPAGRDLTWGIGYRWFTKGWSWKRGRGVGYQRREAAAAGGVQNAHKKAKISPPPPFILPLAGPQLETSWRGTLGSVTCRSPAATTPEAWG